MKQQKGFTLIELIVVIVILGILAATALPKFANLQQDARLSALKGVAGSINSAKSIAHGQWLVNSSVTTIEGVNVTFTPNGYPDASSVLALAGVTQTELLPYSNDNYVVTLGVSGTSGSSDGGSVVLSPKGATSAAGCKITYYASSTGGAPALVTNTASVVSNC